MKRFAAIVAVPAVVLLFLAATGGASGSGSPTQLGLTPGQVSLQTIEPFSYVAITRTGSLDQIEEAVGMLWEAMQYKNIAPRGPLMAIYHGSPALSGTGELQYEIAFPVLDEVEVMDPADMPQAIAKKRWIFSTVAAGLHVGPYDGVGEFIMKMLDWMKANGCVQNGPILERYLDQDLSEEAPQRLQTEIWIPCRKQ